MKKITDWKQLIRDHFQKLTFLIGMMILCVYFSAFAKNFASLSNLVNIAQQTAVIAIVAMGQTIAIAGGGIDLSVGSVVALSSVTCASLLSAGISIPVAVACALLSGIACGFVTGSLVYFGKIPPFIATMGMMSIIRGVVYVITDGVPISGLPPEFSVLGLGKLWGTVPFSVLIMVAIMLLMNIVLKRSHCVSLRRQDWTQQGIHVCGMCPLFGCGGHHSHLTPGLGTTHHGKWLRIQCDRGCRHRRCQPVGRYRQHMGHYFGRFCDGHSTKWA